MKINNPNHSNLSGQRGQNNNKGITKGVGKNAALQENVVQKYIAIFCISIFAISSLALAGLYKDHVRNLRDTEAASYFESIQAIDGVGVSTNVSTGISTTPNNIPSGTKLDGEINKSTATKVDASQNKADKVVGIRVSNSAPANSAPSGQFPIAQSSITAESTQNNINAFLEVYVRASGYATKVQTDIVSGATAHDLLTKLQSEGKITFTQKNFDGLGYFIQSINGYTENLNDVIYWQYKINGQRAKVGVSAYVLQANDTVRFELSKE